MTPTSHSKSFQSNSLQSKSRLSKSLLGKSSRDRLLREAQRDRELAKILPPGPERDALIKKASQAETAAHIDEWLSSPGLQPPK